MPNHLHGIFILDAPVVTDSHVVPIIIDRHIFRSKECASEPKGKPACFDQGFGEDREGHGPSPTGGRRTLSEIARQCKIFSAKRINTIRHTPGKPV